MTLDRCLYCGRNLSSARGVKAEEAGARIAFDPVHLRVWTVCDRCHGWNLWLREERVETLPDLERMAARARLLHRTENVALLDAGGRELIRVGDTDLPEEAWWRYGTELRRRRSHYGGGLSLLGAATYAAVSNVSGNLGFWSITGDFRHSADVYADVMRWRRFGATAWRGRAACPRCQSVLLKLFFFRSRSLVLLPGQGGEIAVGLPCLRCDPGTAEKVHRFEGKMAVRILRRVLAYQNIDGASPEQLRSATRLIQLKGSALNLIREFSYQTLPLSRLDRKSTLALEISVNERAERRQLALETAEIEAGWRRANELAAIIDEEL